MLSIRTGLARCPALDMLTTHGPDGDLRRAGTRRLVNRKWPRWFTANCISTPSFVVWNLGNTNRAFSSDSSNHRQRLTHNAGIVDEDIDHGGCVEDVRCRPPYRVEVAKVEFYGLHIVRIVAPANVDNCVVNVLRAATC